MEDAPDITVAHDTRGHLRPVLLPLLTYPPPELWAHRARLSSEPELPLDMPLARPPGRDR